MSLPDPIAQLFNILLEAVAKGKLGLVTETDPANGHTRYIIGVTEDSQNYHLFSPIGYLTPGKPEPQPAIEQPSQDLPDPTLH